MEFPSSDHKPFNYKDAKLKWADVNVDIDDDSFQITSEEDDSISEFDTRPIPVLQIWNTDMVETELQMLPDGEQLKELISKDANGYVLTKNKRTAFLMAAWMGKLSILRALINDGVPLNTQDKSGRTALHLAAYSGHCDCLWLLLQNGAEIDTCETQIGVTPLHCAANMGHLSCVRLLIKHGAHVNVGIEKRSPLHYAVQSRAIDCVKELLENNAVPNTPQVYSEAPLHVAAALGFVEIVKLLIQYGAAVNVQCGEDKLTPLHLAAEQGYPECVEVLIEAGAIVNAMNRRKQTPLHLSVLSQCTETSEILLKKGANPNLEDDYGRTPLHCSTVNVQRSCECVRSLLRYGADPNLKDAYGYTPLHSAALNEFPNCVKLLLQNGGDVTVKTKGGVSVLNFITKKTPEVMPYFLSRFDNAIKLKNDNIGDVDCQLKIDFRPLVPVIGHPETSLLINFIGVGQKQILEHPLCETFLLLKWRVIRIYFIFSLIYQVVFVILFSCYIHGVYFRDCLYPEISDSKAKISKTVKEIYIEMSYGLIVLNVLSMLKELFQILHSWKTYVHEWENYLQWAIILSVFCCASTNVPMYKMTVQEFLDHWQHRLAALSIFLAWLELMIIIARFPTFGVYVQMLSTVSFNFFKFMLAYCFLIIGFTLCFGLIFADSPTFSQLKFAFLKIVIMMSGELEYEDVFSKEKQLIYPYTSHLIYCIFVILVTIVLSNLMVGLAVNDIQALQKNANLDSLIRQVRLMAHLEQMLFSKLLKWVPPNVIAFLHSRALLLKSQRDITLVIKPNDPRERKIPKLLIERTFELALRNNDKRKSSRRNRLSQKSIKGSLIRKEVENPMLQLEAMLLTEINKIIKQKIQNFKRDFT